MNEQKISISESISQEIWSRNSREKNKRQHAESMNTSPVLSDKVYSQEQLMLAQITLMKQMQLANIQYSMQQLGSISPSIKKSYADIQNSNNMQFISFPSIHQHNRKNSKQHNIKHKKKQRLKYL